MPNIDRGLNLYRDSRVLAAVAESEHAPVTFRSGTVLEHGSASGLTIVRDRVAVMINNHNFIDPKLRSAQFYLFSKRLGRENPQLEVALPENRDLSVVELGIVYPTDSATAVMQEELPAKYLLKDPPGAPKSLTLIYSLSEKGKLKKTVNAEGTGVFLIPEKLESVEDEPEDTTWFSETLKKVTKNNLEVLESAMDALKRRLAVAELV